MSMVGAFLGPRFEMHWAYLLLRKQPQVRKHLPIYLQMLLLVT
jgi:hypothetical protein